MNRRLPCRGASFPAIGMTTSPGALQASSRVPACDGVRCCAVWKNWDIRNGAPNSPANRQKLTPFAAANLGWRNIASDSIGFGDRRSHSSNPAVKAAPPASAPITSPLAQPTASARIRPPEDPEQPRAGQCQPGQVQARFPAEALADLQGGHRDQRQADGDVDPEDPVPAPVRRLLAGPGSPDAGVVTRRRSPTAAHPSNEPAVDGGIGDARIAERMVCRRIDCLASVLALAGVAKMLWPQSLEGLLVRALPPWPGPVRS